MPKRKEEKRKEEKRNDRKKEKKRSGVSLGGREEVCGCNVY